MDKRKRGGSVGAPRNGEIDLEDEGNSLANPMKAREKRDADRKAQKMQSQLLASKYFCLFVLLTIIISYFECSTMTTGV